MPPQLQETSRRSIQPSPLHRSNIQSHLQYIGITADDAAALRAARRLVVDHLPAFVDRFYKHLQNFESTRVFLSDPHTVRRLLAAQKNYVLSIFDAKFDEDYYQYRRLIGHTHFRIGLDFQSYIGSYALFLEYFLPLLAGDVKAQSAFNKAILLDMSVVLEAYHDGDKAALEASKAQVIQQEKLAAIGLLASGLAHEIGNPLASIHAICENQLRKHSDAVPIEMIKRIKAQIGQLTSIVRQLVGFARPTPAEWRLADVNEFVEASLSIARLARSPKNVDIQLKLSSELPRTYCIGDQLSQVFLNLILNAFDALPDSGGRLIVRSAVNNSSICIEVEDNGSGMPEPVLARLFTPFFTTKEIGKGTGLGLHVCDSITKNHGGDIQVRSQPDRGSIFIVRIPVRETPGK
jgi:signal transduction histidine kinase